MGSLNIGSSELSRNAIRFDSLAFLSAFVDCIVSFEVCGFSFILKECFFGLCCPPPSSIEILVPSRSSFLSERFDFWRASFPMKTSRLAVFHSVCNVLLISESKNRSQVTARTIYELGLSRGLKSNKHIISKICVLIQMVLDVVISTCTISSSRNKKANHPVCEW